MKKKRENHSLILSTSTRHGGLQFANLRLTKDPEHAWLSENAVALNPPATQYPQKGQTISVIGAISQTSSGTCEWKCHSTCISGINVASGTVTFLLIKGQVDFDDEILVAKNILDGIDYQIGVTGLSLFRKGSWVQWVDWWHLMTLQPQILAANVAGNIGNIQHQHYYLSILLSTNTIHI